MISLIFTIHNKGWLLDKTLPAIAENISELTKEIIFVVDGCTDNSLEVISGFSFNVPKMIVVTDDIWEVKANNVGLKLSKRPYSILIQDDMVITEKNFDSTLLMAAMRYSDILAVSGITAVDDEIKDGHVNFVNPSGNSKNIFYVRTAAVRGPLLLDNSKLARLGYLDETFAPLTFDDHDLCIRAYEQFGWVSGSYPIGVVSRPEWGTTRQPEKVSYWQTIYNRNEQIIIGRYPHIKSHAEERII